MNANIPDKFLKHVNLRSPQFLAETDKSKDKKYLRAPSGYQSQLVSKIEQSGADKPKQVRAHASEVYKKIGPVEQEFPHLQVNLARVFQSKDDYGLQTRFQSQFNMSANDFLGSTKLQKLHHHAWEVYYCLSVNPEQLASVRERHSDIIKAINAIEYIASLDDDREAELRLFDLFALKIVLPAVLFPKAEKSKKTTTSKDDERTLGEIDKLLSEAERLDAMEEKIVRADRQFYSKGPGAKTKPQAIPLDGGNIEGRGKDDAAEGFEVVEPENWLLEELSRKIGDNTRRGSEKELFSQTEHKILNDHKEKISGFSPQDAVDVIRRDLYKRAKQVVYSPKMAMSARVYEYPKTRQLVQKMQLPLKKGLKKGGFLLPSPLNLPRVHQLGVGDLYVLEQQVNRYAMGEVAHIENVMAKETRNREHIRISETENTLTTETEETITDEKSLQTTDRFEMSKETEKQVKASLEASAGFSISASYGPVTAGANGNIATSTSTSASKSSSTSFAREVVEKSVSQITSRVREENILRVLNRIEETNFHGFTNDTDKNLCGIYRWVDKYYLVRNVNYGRRLMLELIIPEPAAGYLYAEQMHPEHEDITPPPDPIDFDPDYVSRSNYLDLVADYNATDVNAPPPKIIYKSLNIAKAKDGSYTEFADVDTSMTIDTGYKTTNVYGYRWRTFPGNMTNGFLKVLVANRALDSESSELPGVTGNLTVSAHARAISYSAGIKVRCELTDQAFEDWQIETWNALQSAQKAAVAEYESKIAAAAIGAGVQIHGRNPGQNEEIIRTELKRSAIKFLSDDMAEIIVDGQVRTNEVFNAADSTGDFSLDQAKIEGSIIQFFEQAFEWDNMMWKFYPYFWARESERHEKLLAEDHDPVFRDFRRAGAARVVLPVPMAYQDAVLHFFETNEVWRGGDTPVLNDPEYLSIVDDLRRGQTNSFNSAIYYQDEDSVPPYIVDEWEIKLPTSLVKLQSDDVLPNFATSLTETDVETVLDALATANNFDKEWRNSIINLLELLGLATDEAARRTLAETKGYPSNADSDAIANINQWLYDVMLAEISANGLP